MHLHAANTVVRTPSRIIVHRPDLQAPARPVPTQTEQPPSAPPAGPIQMAKTVFSSTARWVAAGRPKVSPATLAFRREKCGGCGYWNPAGWMGLGRCTLCGCSGIKLEWATERCPKTPPDWGPETP